MTMGSIAALRKVRWSLGGLIALAVFVVVMLVQGAQLLTVTQAENADLQRSAQDRATNALDMLAAIHTSAMRNRVKMAEGDGAIRTLDDTMAQLSAGKSDLRLWLVMGPKIVAFQRAQSSAEIEQPRDNIDRLAIASARQQMTIDEHHLRIARPIVFGRGTATATDCGRCHAAMMDIRPGEVMGAYSVEVGLRSGIAALRQRNLNHAGVALAALLLLAALIMGLVNILALRPLERLRKSTTALAAGDYGITISDTDRGDEIGALAGSLKLFGDRLAAAQRIEHELDAQRARNAEAERSIEHARDASAAKAREQAARQAAMYELSDRFEESVAGVVSAVRTAASGLAHAAEQLVGAANSASNEAAAIAGASVRASSDVANVARATRELSNSIEKIAVQVTRQSHLTGDASGYSELGAQTAQRLTQKAEDIRGILSLVQNVAGQTNLLALNASIESARAGDAGRGFAVVANEVKQLASQTSDSVTDIDAMVRSVRGEVDQTVGSIMQVATSLGEVRDIAAALAMAVEQQHAVAADISRHASTAADGTRQVNESIVELAAAATQADDLARTVGHMSSDLNLQAEQLDVATSGFVAHLRGEAAA